VDVRTLLLQAIDEIKGPEVRASVESGERWLTSVDSLDLLEILASFDAKLGRITDPQRLPKSFEDFETVVARLSQIHGLA